MGAIADLPKKAFLYQAADYSGADGAAISAFVDNSGNGFVPSAITNTSLKLAQTPNGSKVIRIATGAISLDRLPVMGPVGWAAATVSAVYNSSYDASHLVDGSNGGVGWASGAVPSVGTPQWARLQPNAATVATSYQFLGTSSARFPKDFKLQGSNDGSSWTDLDTRTNVTAPAHLYVSFAITGNTTAYTYYRLLVTATGGADMVHLMEFGLNEISTLSGGEFWCVMRCNVTSTNAWKFGISGQENHFSYSGNAVYSDFGCSGRFAYTAPSVLTTGFHIVRLQQTRGGTRREWIDQRLCLETVSPLGWGTSPKLASSWSGDIAMAMFVRTDDGLPYATARTIYEELNTAYGLTVPLGEGDDGPGLWLKADDLTGLADNAAVPSWTSSDGKKLPLTGYGNPTYKAAAVNGKAVVRFDGVDDRFIVDANQELSWDGPQTIITAFKPALTGNISLLGGTANGAFCLRIDAGKPNLISQGVALLGASSGRSPTALPNAMCVLTAIWRPCGDFAEYYVDAATGMSPRGGGIYLGSGNLVESAVTAPTQYHWMRIRPRVPTAAVSYQIMHRPGFPGRAPTAFDFQGANDSDGPWVTLDSQSGITGWTDLVAKSFSVPGGGTYKYYRVVTKATVSDPIYNVIWLSINDLPLRADGSWEFRLNGQPLSSGLVAVTTLGTTAVTVIGAGHGNGAGEFFNGDLGELKRYHRECSLAEIVADETAMMTRWGITPATPPTLADMPMIGIKASAEYNYSQWRASLLGDGVIGGPGNSWAGTVNNAGTITSEFIPSRVLKQYKVVARSDAGNQAPTAWTIQASDDLAGSWTTVDTRSAISWTNSEVKTFDVTNSTAYRYYRMVITASNNTLASFTELYYLGDPAVVSGGGSFVYTPVVVSGATASSSSPGAPPNNLFDESTTTYWEAAVVAPVTVQASLPAAKKIGQYDITARADKPTAAPKSWTFEGSTDGSSWTTIDTQSGQTFSAAQTKRYTKANNTAYTYYRLVVTEAGVSTEFPSFTDWKLQEATPEDEVIEVTFAIGGRLFGVSYAAGQAVPSTWSTRLIESLVARGRVSPGVPLVVKKAAKINGTAYAAGASWPGGVSPRVARQLLRGRVIGKT